MQVTNWTIGHFMRIANRIIIVLGCCFFMFSLYAHILPSLICIAGAFLGFFILVLALLATVVLGLVRWRKSTRSWMIPVLLCLAFMSSAWINGPIGVFIADQLFRSHLNEYSQVVDDVRSGVIPCGAGLSILDIKEYPTHIIAVKGARCTNGAVVVAFLVSTDIPLLHEGYVFKGYAETNTCVADEIRPERQWPYVRHVMEKWYHFADQPGL
jgi:hypothetical protein